MKQSASIGKLTALAVEYQSLEGLRMPVYVALLRAINVGGRNRVAMPDLRELLEELGFARVRSLLQSGNLIFDAPRLAAAKFEKQLENATEEHLKVAVQLRRSHRQRMERPCPGEPFPTRSGK